MEQTRPQIPAQYYEIGRVMDTYKQTICNKFRNNQALLVEQLEQKVRQLKKSIAQNKQKTSQQSIEQLISKKRHQKQAERLELQIHWRNLTQKYKKLQQQEKKINQENRENKFDILNLENKIETLKKENIQLDERLAKLKEDVKNQSFLTEINNSVAYVSPYKYSKAREFSQSKNIQTKKFDPGSSDKKNEGKLLSSSSNFRLKLQLKNKKIISKQSTKFASHQKENNYQNEKNDSNNQKDKDLNSQFTFELQYKRQKLQQQSKHFLKDEFENMKSVDINAVYGKRQNGTNKNQSNLYRFSTIKDRKWEELMSYLDKPEVRQKVFDLLRK